MFKRFLFITAISGFICVAFGALASHALSHLLPEKALQWIEIGLRYQVFHTLALFGLVLLMLFTQTGENNRKKLVFTGYCWTIGIVLFSFSLYVLALTNYTAIAHIVPLGGISFLIGWGGLIYLAITYTTQKSH